MVRKYGEIDSSPIPTQFPRNQVGLFVFGVRTVPIIQSKNESGKFGPLKAILRVIIAEFGIQKVGQILVEMSSSEIAQERYRG